MIAYVLVAGVALLLIAVVGWPLIRPAVGGSRDAPPDDERARLEEDVEFVASPAHTLPVPPFPAPTADAEMAATVRGLIRDEHEGGLATVTIRRIVIAAQADIAAGDEACERRRASCGIGRDRLGTRGARCDRAHAPGRRPQRRPRPRRVTVKYGQPMQFEALREEAKTCSKPRLKEIYQKVADEIMAAIARLEPRED